MSNKALQYGQQMTLTSLLDLHRSGTKRQINCHQVGEIVSFDPDSQTAEVQIKMSYLINGEIREYPLLIDCPCIILAGGDGALTMPITAGDSCLVLFNDRDMDNWYSGGQTMPPRTDRMHDFADAIALVGLRNKQNKLSGFLANGTELKYGSSTIKLENGKVTITNGTSTATLNGNNVTVTDGAAQVVISAGTVSVTGTAISLTGAVAVTGTFTVNGKDLGENHIHSGVRTGTGNTGGVV